MSPPAVSSFPQERTLLVFSHLRWDFVFQRPQHLLSRAARKYRVLFFEEPQFEAAAQPHLRSRLSTEGVRVVTPILPAGLSENGAVAEQRRLLDGLLLPIDPALLTLWYYAPAAMRFSRHVEADLRVYDCMDELTLFKGADPRLHKLEAELLKRADLVFTGGRSLYEAKRHLHANIHQFSSSIDVAHFARVRGGLEEEPGDQKRLSGPRIGYFAVIDERLDLALLDRAAALRPAWQFVVIGPVVKIDSQTLPQRPNLHWLGPKPYPALPAYLGGWAAGLMPFAINDATRFISPTKTPEFLAAGLPVVSTPITDVIDPYGKSGLVEIAVTAEDAVERLEHVLARPRAAWLARVYQHLSSMSWDRTWTHMSQLMDRAAGQQKTAATPKRDALAVEAAHV